MSPDRIVPDGLYVNDSLTRWRRVIAIVNGGRHGGSDEDYVTYSRGSDKNGFCLLRTFCRWARKRITVDADGLVEEVCQSTTC